MSGETVELRAFRGTRRSSVYRAHAVSSAAFARIVAAGAGHALAGVRNLAADVTLDKQEARQLADELGSIRASLELPDLDADLTALAEIARWCSRASGDAWLRVE
jgi:hypothetical protein